jgi:hypothetical protein
VYVLNGADYLTRAFQGPELSIQYVGEGSKIFWTKHAADIAAMSAWSVTGYEGISE